MGTRLSAWDMEAEVLRTFDANPEENEDGWGTLEQARAAFFRRGDLIAIEHRGAAVRALVLHAGWEYSSRSGDWIPLYRVRPYRRDGTPGATFRWAYPGDIERGFAALGNCNTARPSADRTTDQGAK